MRLATCLHYIQTIRLIRYWWIGPFWRSRCPRWSRWSISRGRRGDLFLYHFLFSSPHFSFRKLLQQLPSKLQKSLLIPTKNPSLTALNSPRKPSRLLKQRLKPPSNEQRLERTTISISWKRVSTTWKTTARNHSSNLLKRPRTRTMEAAWLLSRRDSTSWRIKLKMRLKMPRRKQGAILKTKEKTSYFMFQKAPRWSQGISRRSH